MSRRRGERYCAWMDGRGAGEGEARRKKRRPRRRRRERECEGQERSERRDARAAVERTGGKGCGKLQSVRVAEDGRPGCTRTPLEAGVLTCMFGRRGAPHRSGNDPTTRQLSRALRPWASNAASTRLAPPGGESRRWKFRSRLIFLTLYGWEPEALSDASQYDVRIRCPVDPKQSWRSEWCSIPDQ